MDAEERRALEAELAAELAGLSDDDNDYGEEVVTLNDGERAHSQDSGGSSGDYGEYVRLDLDQLLRQIAASDQNAKQQTRQSTVNKDNDAGPPAMSSWGLLLASVETSEAEFFQFIRQDLHEIQTSILTPAADVIASPAPVSNADPAQIDADTSQQTGGDRSSSLTLLSSTTISENGSDIVRNEQNHPSRDLDPEPHEQTATRRDQSCPNIRPLSPVLDSDRAATEDQSSNYQQEPSNSTHGDRSANTLPSVLPAQPPGLSVTEQESSQLRLEEDKQSQLKLIQDQHLKRQQHLQRAQEARQLEQELIARQIKEMETRFAEEEEAQRRRERELQQAKERLAMQKEELLIRYHLAAVQRAKENQLMTQEERISQIYHDFLRDKQRNRERECLAMAFEEAFEWKRVRFEAEKQKRERLMEEKCVLRCRFNSVMFELVANHEVKAAEQKKREDSARKREARELTLMRSEELFQRRVSAQRRALEDEQSRKRERDAMMNEDALAQAVAVCMAQQMTRERVEMEREDNLAMSIRALAENRRQALNRLLMAREEERSRIAQVLEIQRAHVCVRRQEICRRILVHRKRVAFLGLAWGQWQSVIAGETSAVLRIQRCYRVVREHRRIRIEDSEASEYASEEASAAAMVVQSIFRGFSIRRKFANALEMVQLVGGVNDELEFGEVNLDDLIQMPPELEDGWENPVLPVSRHSQHDRQHHQSVAPVVDRFDEEEGPECGDYEGPEQPELTEDSDYRYTPGYGSYTTVAGSGSNRAVAAAGGGSSQHSTSVAEPQFTQLSKKLPLQDTTPLASAPPANLASTLWDKMRKMKQKQRHAAEERSREQDPTYRLQKLMSKGNKKQQQVPTKATSSNNSNSGNIPSTTASNAPTISWGSSNGNGEKKKPKVKLPSLVERLRKKTEAAR